MIDDMRDDLMNTHDSRDEISSDKCALVAYYHTFFYETTSDSEKLCYDGILQRSLLTFCLYYPPPTTDLLSGFFYCIELSLL